MTENDLVIMEQFLRENCQSFGNDMLRIRGIAAKRANNHVFTVDEYVEGMVRALLTNSVRWEKIAPYFENGCIDTIFHNYSANVLKNTPFMEIVNGLRSIRCGNRRDVLQMRSLNNNIQIIEDIFETFGSFDMYLQGIYRNFPIISIYELNDFESNGRYKLGGMGIPLVCEFLKNMGYLIPKPDVHLKTILGNERMGASRLNLANNAEVFSQIENLSRGGQYTIPEIDLILWSFCADGYGEICTRVPNCGRCPFAGTESCNYRAK